MQEKVVSNASHASTAERKMSSLAPRLRQTISGNASRINLRENRLLLVVDESASSKVAVEYVAKVLGHRRGFRVWLAHFLPPLPPILMEFGGSENPDKEVWLDSQLHRDQEQWINSAKKKAEPALNRARRRLRRAGLPSTSLITQFSDPAGGQDNACNEMLDLARLNNCRTIVIGRRSLSWFSRITAGRDLAEKLVQQGKDLAIWIVE